MKYRARNFGKAFIDRMISIAKNQAPTVLTVISVYIRVFLRIKKKKLSGTLRS